MLSKMSVSVDRCNDFYSYACEAFINDVTIPPSNPYYSTLSGEIRHRRDARLRKVSENSIDILQLHLFVRLHLATQCNLCRYKNVCHILTLVPHCCVRS